MENSVPQATRTALDESWRQWIAENLWLDGDPGSLLNAMISNGIDPLEASRELQLALDSPYVRGARRAGERLKNRLKKRDWVLDVYRKLSRQRPDSGTVERRHQLGAEAFFRDYYLQNKPVIITGMIDSWPALTKWRFGYFKERFAERIVEVQTGRDQDANYEINCPQHRTSMKFGDYVDRVATSAPTNDFYMTANNSSSNKVALQELWDDIRPIAEYLDADSPDNGFFWFGPAGTRTPFHHDLTNNFMAQVMGRKQIKLIPACELAYVYNHFHCYTPVNGAQVDYERFPQMREAQVLDCVLSPGELLFLPVGCWHYVAGLEPTVTMSFINFKLDNDFGSFYTTFHEV